MTWQRKKIINWKTHWSKTDSEVALAKLVKTYVTGSNPRYNDNQHIKSQDNEWSKRKRTRIVWTRSNSKSMLTSWLEHWRPVTRSWIRQSFDRRRNGTCKWILASLSKDEENDGVMNICCILNACNNVLQTKKQLQNCCFATKGLLCNRRVALQQKGCFATKGLLCNKRVALQQKGCFATKG